MATYTVKNGENLYDIALKLFGSVEGIFNLLVCNTDAISETGLSLYDTLEKGMVLNYTERNINADITRELLGKKASVRNGEHLFEYYDPDAYIRAYVKKYNRDVVINSIKLWPDITSYSSGNVSAETIDDFLEYLNLNCVWIEAFTEADIPALVIGNYSKAKNIVTPEKIYVPKMIVMQKGSESGITFNMKGHSVMLIDWGDCKAVDMCVLSNTRQEKEHSYEDNGEHVIKIYGDFEFKFLDLSAINGVYYPLSEITVSGDFYTALPNNTTINTLINRT